MKAFKACENKKSVKLKFTLIFVLIQLSEMKRAGRVKSLSYVRVCTLRCFAGKCSQMVAILAANGQVTQY